MSDEYEETLAKTLEAFEESSTEPADTGWLAEIKAVVRNEVEGNGESD